MFLAYPANCPLFVTFILYSITTSEPFKFLDLISAFASVVFSFWSYVVVLSLFVTVILLTYLSTFRSNVFLVIKPISILDVSLSTVIVSVAPTVDAVPFIVTSLSIASEFSVSLAPLTWYVVVVYIELS